MTDTEVVNGLENINSSLQHLFNQGEGAYIQFSNNPASLSPLKDVLRQVFKASLLEDTKKENENNQNRDKQNNEAADKRSDKSTNGVVGAIREKKKSDVKHYDSLRSLINAIHEKEEKNGKKSLSLQERGVLVLDFANKTLQAIAPGIKEILGVVKNNALQQLDLVAELRSAGVVIKSGFDESFVKFANEAGLSREAFAEYLKENSRFVSSMNARGINGAEILAKESRKLIGTMGLTAREISATTKAYNESMLTTANQADVASINHTNELVKSTRALKTFAMATGQSVENILKEQKERERTWQMQRLATDPRTRNQLMMMRNAGLSDELIEGIMLGKHNKATTMAMLDPNSAAMMQGMRQAFMTTKGNPEAFAKAMMALSNSSAAAGMRRSEANMNVQDYAYVNGLGELFAPGTSIWGKMTAQTFGNNPNELMNGTEVESINAMQQLTSSLNELKNNFVNALSPSLKTISEWIQPGSVISNAVKSIAEWVGKNPVTTLVTYGALLMGKSMAGSFLGGLAQAKAFQLMGVGVGKHASKTLIQALASSKVSMWSKIGKTIGYGAGSIMSTMVAAGIGRSIGAGIGSLFGNAGFGAIAGSAIGGAISGAIWGYKIGGLHPGAWVGALIGLAGGALMGAIEEFTGGKSKTPETNSPSAASNTSTYNTSYVDNEQQSSGGTVQPSTVQSTHSSVSVIGMESLRTLIRENNNILKDVYSEIRTGGLKVGTNLANA